MVVSISFCSSVVGIDSAYTASVLMICVALIGVLFPIGMVVHQLFFARRVPILRDAHTMEPPELLLGEDERYHLFLCPSHPNTNQAARSCSATHTQAHHPVWSQEPHLEHRPGPVRRHQAPVAAAATWHHRIPRR